MSNVVDFVMCFDVSSFGSPGAARAACISPFPGPAAVIKTLFAFIETAIENR